MQIAVVRRSSGRSSASLLPAKTPQQGHLHDALQKVLSRERKQVVIAVIAERQGAVFVVIDLDGDGRAQGRPPEAAGAGDGEDRQPARVQHGTERDRVYDRL